MKHLKSTIDDLRKIFERSICVKDIAEPFASFDDNSSVNLVRGFMIENDYDIIGIRKDGLISGYATKGILSGEKLGENYIAFKKDELVSENDSIMGIFNKLANSSFNTIFVIILGEVGGIVTRGDLQKIPIRMWLFGLISLIEMQSKRIINNFFTRESWKKKLKRVRLREALKLQRDRRSKNLDIGLIKCLQYCDLRTIIINEDKLRRCLNIQSKRKGNNLFKNLEETRNKLAHAQDIITGNWPEVINIVSEGENLLDMLEKVEKT